MFLKLILYKLEMCVMHQDDFSLFLCVLTNPIVFIFTVILIAVIQYYILIVFNFFKI